jgi:hypothetical protein
MMMILDQRIVLNPLREPILYNASDFPAYREAKDVSHNLPRPGCSLRWRSRFTLGGQGQEEGAATLLERREPDAAAVQLDK